MTANHKRKSRWSPVSVALFVGLALIAPTGWKNCAASNGSPPSSRSEKPETVVVTTNQFAKSASKLVKNRTPAETAAANETAHKNEAGISNNFTQLILEGRLSLKNSKIEDAERTFRKARDLQFSNPTANYHLGLIKVRREIMNLRKTPMPKIAAKVKGVNDHQTGLTLFYKVNSADFVQNIDTAVLEGIVGQDFKCHGTSGHDTNEAYVRLFFSDVTGVDFEPASNMGESSDKATIVDKGHNQRREMSFHQGMHKVEDVLMVKAASSELKLVDEALQAIHVLNATPPMACIDFTLLEMPRDDSESLGFHSPSTNLLKILTGPQYHEIQRKLAGRKDVRIVNRGGAGGVYASSGQKIQLPMTKNPDYSLGICPVFSLDDQKVKISLDFSYWGTQKAASASDTTAVDERKLRVHFSTELSVSDGQMAMLGGFSDNDSDLEKARMKLVLFVTPTIIDRFGQPVN